MAENITLQNPITKETQYPTTLAGNVYTSNGSTVEMKIAFLEQIISQMTPVLLWENTAPTTQITADTTITVPSMDDYTYIIVEATESTSNHMGALQFKFKKPVIGYGTEANLNLIGSVTDANNTIRHRVLSLTSATTIVIRQGYTGASASNYSMLPTAIYGVK